MIDLRDRKFTTLDVAESKQLQQILLDNGCRWLGSSNEVKSKHIPYIYVNDDYVMTWGGDRDNWEKSPHKETTIEELLAAKPMTVSEYFCYDRKPMIDLSNGLVNAANVLRNGAKHIDDRAVVYDQPDGERSMGKTVAAFNIITGHSLTEEQGWLFMGVLKQVRSQQGAFKLDNYEDEAAYAALRAECAAKERQQ